MFNHSKNELLTLCEQVLQLAKQCGATAVETSLSESIGQDVGVRLREVEKIEFEQSKSLTVQVYVGGRTGQAATADFSERALRDTVQAAVDIARYTAEDDCAGLADAELMAQHIGELESYHEWNLPVEEVVELAKRCEQAALDYDKRIGNSEGATVQINHYQRVYGNSHGFAAHKQGTRHSISCVMVAADESGMQRAYWYDVARRPTDLATPESIGTTAAKKAVSRLGGRSIATGNYPVLFDTRVAGGLIGHLIGGLAGGALYRRSSFLIGSIGKQILPEFLSLREEPHVPYALGSTYFDAEGVATQPRYVLQNGVVQGYFLGSYSARKLGMKTTGNAGGAHNIYLNHTHKTQADLLKTMGTGLLVTELMGQGVNMLTGDYSRGAAGFWVQDGVIAHPVEEITIAGRLQDMYMNIVGVADDALQNSSNKIGSILLANMTVAGS